MSPVLGYFDLNSSCKAGSPMWDNRSPSMYHFKRHYLSNGNSWTATSPLPQGMSLNGAYYDSITNTPNTNRTNSYFPQMYAFLCSSEYFYFEIEEYEFKDNKLELLGKQYRRVKGLGIPSTENKTLNFKTGYSDSFFPRRSWSGSTGTTYYVKSGEAESYVFDEIDRTIEITKNDNYEYDKVVSTQYPDTFLFQSLWINNTIQGKLLDVAIYKKS
jgi:hypothetical protein